MGGSVGVDSGPIRRVSGRKSVSSKDGLHNLASRLVEVKRLLAAPMNEVTARC
jgi:hypothetical protein